MDSNDSFNIGKRNLMSLRKILWKAGLMLHNEDVGGTQPRTAKLEIATGRIVVSFGRGRQEIAQANANRRVCDGL